MIVAGCALVGSLLLGASAPRQALLAYLAAYVFFLAPALGSIALLMVHALAGGRWGVELRSPLLAATRVLPLLAVLLLPILVGATWLYPWATAESATDPQLAPQRWYLNLPFFWLRAAVCMGVWLWLAHGLRSRLRSTERNALPTAFAAIGLIIYALTITVAAVDWVGSLVPQWHSSALGLTVATAQMLAALALAVTAAMSAGDVATAAASRRDLGTLLMVLVLAWGYLAFMDFITAWIADQPPEIAWYLPRLQSGWRWLGAVIVVLGLLAPFAILLSRRAKQRRRWLRGVAAMLLAAQALFALWLVLPGQWQPCWRTFWTLPLVWTSIAAACWRLFRLRCGQAEMETSA